ncbi:MAG: PH domain-containing protein [Candidatus Saccharimonadales bacterium]
MISIKEVERQLKALGQNYRFWGRPEIMELPNILMPGEQIQAHVNGRYHGGFASFCATDQRLLLIDKKLFYLTVEDLRFDMINEIDFSAQLLSGTINVCTPTKTMTFTTLHPQDLRKLATYIQGRVMQIRQDFGLHPQSAQAGAELAAPQSVVVEPPFAVINSEDEPKKPYNQRVQNLMPRPLHEYLAEVAGLKAPKNQLPELPPAAPSLIERNLMINPNDPAVDGSGQATGHDASVEITELPTPRRLNPYMGAPLLMRHRVGRFGPVTAPPTRLS